MSIRVLAATAALLIAAPLAMAQSFGSMDANNDGVLTYAEARRRLPELSEVIFLKADANGNGVIDPKELPTLQGVYRQVYLDR